ncbi:MAG TPA: hypothetical protein ACFYD6_05215 [Candidatus Brocadiia bacterium]|nr:hypothetical protein [Candidatus Brocadiales bacterium]
MFSNKSLVSLLFALMISVPTLTFADQQSNANGCIGECSQTDAVEKSTPRIIGTFKCFRLTNPDYPETEWEIIVEKAGKTVIGGEITGTICGGLWNITGGTLTKKYLLLNAICAGENCGPCFSSVVIEGFKSGRGRYNGTYIWDGSTIIYNFNAKKHKCQ